MRAFGGRRVFPSERMSGHMKKRYYIAYGSNLHREQMQKRCPHAKAVGTAVLKNYRLVFKGSKTGAYLTIEPSRGKSVPVGIYEITAGDEASLDRYEGFPRFYYKKDMILAVREFGSTMPVMKKAFVYIMNERRAYGMPDGYYVDTCCEGYEDFGFDTDILLQAYKDSREEVWKQMCAG